MSPLVIFPKNNRKWRIFIDYRGINKDMNKYHFPLPFINHILLGKRYLSFLEVSLGITKSSLFKKKKINNIYLSTGGIFLFIDVAKRLGSPTRFLE